MVEEAVTAIIEREMNGAPGLLYTTASSDSTGWASINLVFKQGTNPDLAAVEVQNRLKAVEPRLPRPCAATACAWKAADNIQLVVSLKSDGRLDDMQLGELAASTCCRPCAASTAWARCSCGARKPPCASGPTRPS